LRALDRELDDAVGQREQGVVLADADVVARVVLGAALADDDVAREDGLAAVALDTQSFGFGVAAVTGTAAGFFVCHVVLPPDSGRDGFDAKLGVVLAMA